MYRRTVVAVAVVAIVHSTAPSVWGQEATLATRRNSLEAGAWAIQFQITEDLGLKPFNGMMISLKRHFSAGSAVRLGMNLVLSFDDTDRNQESIPVDTLEYVAKITDERNSQRIQLDLMYVGYPNPRAPVNFFWGAGPLIEYARGHQESEYVATVPTRAVVRTQESSSHSWRTGAVGAAGVEWFATKGIAFHAEYRARLSYGTSESEAAFHEETGDAGFVSAEARSWEFSAVNVILGLSVYF